MKLPVNARPPGTSPSNAQRASVQTSSLPKFMLESQVRTASRNPIFVGHSRFKKSTRSLKGSGKQKWTPETPHIIRNRKHQNPSRLCRSQLIRAKLDLQFTLRLRRQFATPGHHTIIPVKHSNAKQVAPIPFMRPPLSPTLKSH